MMKLSVSQEGRSANSLQKPSAAVEHGIIGPAESVTAAA